MTNTTANKIVLTVAFILGVLFTVMLINISEEQSEVGSSYVGL